MALSYYGSSSKPPPPRTGKTEFEILKEQHRFLRDEEDAARRGQSWDEQLAGKYYDSLYREFAVCDLKHYKSGNFALRWRTEDEVLSGNGETTCGNTRCRHHHPPSASSSTPSTPGLTTLELPFAYAERGEQKNALVKVVLCSRCVDKLMWKRRKERGETLGKGVGEGGEEKQEQEQDRQRDRSRAGDGDNGEEQKRKKERRRKRSRSRDTGAGDEEDRGDSRKSHKTRSQSPGHDERKHRRRSSRSRSPRRNTKNLRFS